MSNYIKRAKEKESIPFTNYSNLEDPERTSLEEGNQRIPQTSVINSSTSRNKSREAVVTPSEIRSHDPYLAQAQDIEISRIDRQEGYDANLVNLQPRTTAQSEVETGILSSSNNLQDQIDTASPSTKKTRKVELPYDSRDPNEEISEESKNGIGKRNGNKQRKKKKPLVWYKKPLNWLLGGLLFLVILGLAIGLGVGLSNHHNNVLIVPGGNPNSTSNITVSNSIAPVPLVSNSGTLPTTVVAPVTSRITPAPAITII